MKRKPLIITGDYTEDDEGKKVPLEGKYREEVCGKCKLEVAELETGHRHEFAKEGA